MACAWHRTPAPDLEVLVVRPRRWRPVCFQHCRHLRRRIRRRLDRRERQDVRLQIRLLLEALPGVYF